jgi:hypothetical protein
MGECQAMRNNRDMRSTLKTVLAFALLTGWPACFAQDAPAVPDQTVSVAEAKPGSSVIPPAKDLAAGAANSPAGSIPVPRAGDPFFAPVAVSRAPQTFHRRLMDYAVVAFGPRALFTPALGSAFSMLHPPSEYPRDWRQGMGAFGRIYGSRIATHTSEQTARFLTAALLHEDFRYRPSTSGNFLVRSLHAVAFTLVDKSDSGNARIAFSNFAGAAADGLTPTLYLPSGYNSLSRAETRMAFALGGFALKNLTREFAPDLFRVTRKLHVPFPRIPIPAWWAARTPRS